MVAHAGRYLISKSVHLKNEDTIFCHLPAIFWQCKLLALWFHCNHQYLNNIAPSDAKRRILENVKGRIWVFYQELKDYKVSPDQAKRIQLNLKQAQL